MKVMSSSKRKFYEVTHSSCTCPDFTYRQAKVGGKCKHMIKLFYPKVLNDIESIKLVAIRNYFRGGVSIDESYEKYGDVKINSLIALGEICRHKVKGTSMFWLLE